MSRQFSMFRRRENLVDLLVTPTAGVDGYRFKWAPNFDTVAWTTFITTGHGGFADPAVDHRKLTLSNGPRVRVTFDPRTFLIPDAAPFWLQLFPVVGGVEGAGGPSTLILPPQASLGFSSFVLSGTALQAVDQAHAMQLDLPRGARQTVRVQNEVDMQVAFDVGGPEFFLPADPVPKYLDVWMPQGSIWVRGVGGAALFSAMFTQAA